MVQRRKFIRQMALSVGTVYVMPSIGEGMYVKVTRDYLRIIASEVKTPEVAFPKEKRIPLGWKAFPIPASSDHMKRVTMQFPKIENGAEPLLFRLTSAIDFREEVTILAYLPDSGIEIGKFDIRFSHPFQPFQISVESKFIRNINNEGIALRMTKGAQNTWFFGADFLRTDNLGLQPQLLIGTSNQPEKSFRNNLMSMNSFSPFGWMGGCVIDALWEMSQKGDDEASKILKYQLSFFLDAEKGIIFESPMTQPLDGTFNSIEDFLPFAAIVGVYPDHISVQKALDFLKSNENDEGIIVSGGDITTEACYTVAYPLAAIAVHRYDRQLAQTAINQVLFRTRFLSDNNTIFQRSSLEGHQSYANWGRGVVWYLVGIAKTLTVFKNSNFSDLNGINEMEEDFVRAIQAVEKWQSTDGVWGSFIDRPETGLDSSATAGIALAYSMGHKLELLDLSYVEKAKKAYQSLLPLLTPDGFLTNVSQINRGGEDLQSSSYRVISQFGMGLMAQLKCSLPC
jgi:hypothetical protein